MIASTFASREGNRCAAGIRRHCYTCFPFPGATKDGTSARRGSVYSRASQGTKETSTSSDWRRRFSHGLTRAPHRPHASAPFSTHGGAPPPPGNRHEDV